MSLTDIGVAFKMTGADSFASQMNQMKSSFEGFSSSLGGSAFKGHLNKMEGHLSAMRKGIKKQLHLTELAVAGFLSGKAIKGLSNWVLGGTGAEIDQLKDYLRIHGATTKGLENMANSMDALSAKRPLDKVGAWNAGENMLSMLGGLDDPKLTDRLLKATSNLALLLDAQGNMSKAVDLATPFVAGFGAKLDAKGKVALHEQFNAYIKYLTDNTQLRGPDIQNILPQLIGPYLGAGKDPAEMFAHMGMLDFLRGQSGEVLKNLFGKEGKSFGAIGAELDKQSYIADLQTNPRFYAAEAKRAWKNHGERLKRVIMSEADLPKALQHELNESVRNRQKDYEAQGGRLLAEGKSREYSSLMLGALTKLRHLQSITGKSVNSIIAEHFGETAIKGIFPFLEGVASGKDQQHIARMKAIDPSTMTEDTNSKFQSLGSKYKTFEQALEALDKTFRRTLEPAVIDVLAGWQHSIEAARTKIAAMKQESQISQNIKDVIGGVRGGFLDKVYGEGVANSSKTMEEAITSFAKSLAQPGWGEIGKKMGAAVGDFVIVLGQIKDIVGTLHKALSSFMPDNKSGRSPWLPLLAAYEAQKLGGKSPLARMILAAGAFMGTDYFLNGPGEMSEALKTYGLKGLPFQGNALSPGDAKPPPLMPEVVQPQRPGNTIMPPQSSSGDGSTGWGLPQVTVSAQAKNVFQVDGKVLAEEFTSLIIEKIDKAIEARKNGRDNATGAMLGTGF